jgi:hypothetical protein
MKMPGIGKAMIEGKTAMSPTRPDGENESDRQQDAMKDQLRKDVASWSAARSSETQDAGSRVAKPAAPARAVRQKAKPVVAAPVVPEEKKPFRMSYDGTTDRDYIAQRIKLGAR